MSQCCRPFAHAASDQFGDAVARRDLAAYRRRGPDKPTRLMRDAVLSTGVSKRTLLDVGGGIGALSLELAAAGVAHATLVDASPAYLSAAREESARLHRGAQIDLVAGDFVELAATLPITDVVTMNRVVCCYPDVRGLLTTALEHCAHVFAFSYPKDRWYIRAVAGLGNRLRALTGKPFRTFVHDEAAMHALVEARGFRRSSRRDTLVWRVEVWTR